MGNLRSFPFPGLKSRVKVQAILSCRDLLSGPTFNLNHTEPQALLRTAAKAGLESKSDIFFSWFVSFGEDAVKSTPGAAQLLWQDYTEV